MGARIPKGYRRRRGLTRLPIPTRDFSRSLLASSRRDSSLLVLGVAELTLLDGRQYSLSPPAPQGFPVLWSTHFSLCQRFKLRPSSPLRA